MSLENNSWQSLIPSSLPSLFSRYLPPVLPPSLSSLPPSFLPSFFHLFLPCFIPSLNPYFLFHLLQGWWGYLCTPGLLIVTGSYTASFINEYIISASSCKQQQQNISFISLPLKIRANISLLSSPLLPLLFPVLSSLPFPLFPVQTYPSLPFTSLSFFSFPSLSVIYLIILNIVYLQWCWYHPVNLGWRISVVTFSWFLQRVEYRYWHNRPPIRAVRSLVCGIPQELPWLRSFPLEPAIARAVDVHVLEWKSSDRL